MSIPISPERAYPTAQGGWAISQSEGAFSMYLSPSIGAKYGAPGSGFTQNIGDAMLFARQQDAEQFMRFYMPGQSMGTAEVRYVYFV